MLQLRDYQERSLNELTTYLRKASEIGAKSAFIEMTGRQFNSMAHIKALNGLPYVCLRVPTGGGKTLMASHALCIAGAEFVQHDHPLCLWLAPSNAIVQQTMDALKDRAHPYRQVLDAAFSGNVRVMDLSETFFITKGDLDGATCIIVATIQSLRVEDTDGRKVYESAGALQHHFDSISKSEKERLEIEGEGSIIFSLANVLRLRRPVVIMDEAHNARTPLSFDTLSRFHPSCIIEFTATPETNHKPEDGIFASNILHQVSARELKEAEMVKLPIKFSAIPDWRECVGAAVATQRSLEKHAEDERAETGEYIRPIVLLQAQSIQGDDLNVEKLKQSLITDYRIPEEQIAIATGTKREILGVDLFDEKCSIRFIITVRALVEGWDCSFAYMLCSVSEVSTARSVEQVLGRILRLPGAKKKKRQELNCAYTFSASQDFMQTAQSLQDALIEGAGFQKLEAKDMIVPQDPLQRGLWEGGGMVTFPEISEQVSDAPDLSKISEDLRGKVEYTPETQTLTITGPISEQDADSLGQCFESPESKRAVERIVKKAKEQHEKLIQPVPVEPLKIPLLSIRVGEQLELFEETNFREVPWDLSKCDAALSESEFPSESTSGKTGEIDVRENGKLETKFVEDLHKQMRLFANEPGWTIAALSNWMDSKIPHPDIPRSQSNLFFYNAINDLIESRGMTIDRLAREKFRLIRALRNKAQKHRNNQHKKAYQALLFGPDAMPIEVSDEHCIIFDEDKYAPGWQYDGVYKFQKHLFKPIGELKDGGEEWECAIFIDQMPAVKTWVRNIERRPDSSFWLQTSTDRFYPDFIALLNDGRILVIEYKGADRWSNDDSKEKRAVGELWAERSSGKCLFVMPKGKDWGRILETIGK